jgi:hypothetical protein
MTENDRIIELIRERMKSWGHNNAPGCLICLHTRLLIEAIEADAALVASAGGKRYFGDVTVTGPDAP